ncbi:hypothetical protein NZA98_11695, partial [Escherichia coli]|nr:hypothetical protein [Escherichia coli]
MHRPLQLCSVIPVAGLARAIEIGADLLQALDRYLRPDIIENDAGEKLWRDGCQNMRDQPAAGSAEKNRPVDLQMGKTGNDIARFHPDIVVRPVRIIG